MATLKHWQTVRPSSEFVVLQNLYEGTCTLYRDGRVQMDSVQEGSWVLTFPRWLASLEEARDVARNYFGEEWGK